MQYVFGPVHSRRLGLSLGIDPVQGKTCTLDCVYCQLGATAVQTSERRVYAPAEAVVDEVRRALASGARPDCITFSGTGEPTLNSELGSMIAGVRAVTDVPAVVITNSTLLHRGDVRADLMQAGIVMPSASTVSAQVFSRLCRPLPGFDFRQMLRGLELFSRDYQGRLWVEVMLVAGVNDSEDDLQSLADFLNGLHCEKIQINTVTRPPAEKHCAAAASAVLDRARQLFGPRAGIIGSAAPPAAPAPPGDPPGRILALVRSHPCTLEQVCAALGLERAQAEAALRDLLSGRRIEKTQHEAQIFYRALGR